MPRKKFMRFWTSWQMHIDWYIICFLLFPSVSFNPVIFCVRTGHLHHLRVPCVRELSSLNFILPNTSDACNAVQ